MSEVVKAALSSVDVQEVKNVRKVEKSAFTRCETRLKSLLVTEADGFTYKLGVIRFDEIVEIFAKYEKAYDNLQNLHARVNTVRQPDANEIVEKDNLLKEEKYIETVENSYYEVRRLVSRYKSQKEQVEFMAESSKLEARPNLVFDKYCSAKKDAEEAVKMIEGKDANEILSLADSLLLKPVQLLKNTLNASFTAAHEEACSLKEKYLASGVSEEQVKCVIKFNYDDELAQINKVVAKLDTMINAQFILLKDRENTKKSPESGSSSISSLSHAVKLAKPDALSFSGNSRDWSCFSRDFDQLIVPGRDDTAIGVYFKQAIPARLRYLLDKCALSEWRKMKDIIKDELGTARHVVDNVVTEIKRMKPVTGEKADKMFVEFVEKVERIVRDLTSDGLLQEISNNVVISELESKLPIKIAERWSELNIEKDLANKLSSERFKELMSFLDRHKKVVKFHSNDARQPSISSRSQTCYVTGQTFVVKAGQNSVEGKTSDLSLDSKTCRKCGAVGHYARDCSVAPATSPDKQKESNFKPCLACHDGATNASSVLHSTDTCAVWNGLTVGERTKKVSCIKHPFWTGKGPHTTANCTAKVRACSICNAKDSHHFLLCPSRKVVTMVSKQVKSSSLNVANSRSVLLPLYVVRGSGNIKYGAMVDGCSTDNYIKNKVARRHNLRIVDEVQLEIEGMGEVKTSLKNVKVYEVSILDKHDQEHKLLCYGVDNIASLSGRLNGKRYDNLCAKFNYGAGDIPRPSSIDLLISMRESHLHPESKIRTVGKLTLFSGPLGPVFGGEDPENIIPVAGRCFISSNCVMPKLQTATYRAAVREVLTGVSHTYLDKNPEKKLLDYFQEDSIGVDCQPKCGNCLCGKCALGEKKMSLKDEREYLDMQSRMRYDAEGRCWWVKFNWTVPKEALINNKPAVMRVMEATKRKLDKNPEWRDIYEMQLKDLIERGVAREILDDELDNHVKSGGTVYYIAHQMALNPGSKSTPVRCVFNGSQQYKGFSLNSSVALGPEEIMNDLTGMLLRFREGLYAAQGDIKKMFYAIKVEYEEEMCQLWVWKFAGEEKIRTFAMGRLIMGNKSSTNYSTIAVQETAKLLDFKTRFPVAYNALVKDTYVDNVLLTSDTTEELVKGIEDIEFVAGHGNMFFKPWIKSGEDIPIQTIQVSLPNAVQADEEKALGLSWDVKPDLLSVKPAMLADKKKGGVAVLTAVDNGAFILNPSLTLTLRLCLSVHAQSFDPLGFVLPVRMVGNILFRKTLQFLKTLNLDAKRKIPWDTAIENFDADHRFYDRWLDYFSMLNSLKNAVFNRSYKPPNFDPSVKPVLVTFCDGNEDAFGVIVYALWSLLDGTKTSRFILAKAKLGPLLNKGEVVKNELSGSVLAARAMCWIKSHTGLEFSHSVHFLDSRIVQDMMLKESYGFNTFAGLRVSELQKKTDLTKWFHIASSENIADILTKGSTPDHIGQNSLYQTGPLWLIENESSWPITVRTPLTAEQLETVKRFEKVIKPVIPIKLFGPIKPKLEDYVPGSRSSDTSQLCLLASAVGPATFELDELMSRCGNLRKLINSTAYVLRLVGRKHNKLGCAAKVSPIDNIIPVDSSEHSDAWNYLIHWEQQQRFDKSRCEGLVPVFIEFHLSNYPILVSQALLGGRVRNFPQGYGNGRIPIIPYGRFGLLIVQHYHQKYHRDIDTTVAMVRADVWVIQARKLASRIDSRCIICKLKRKTMASQIMGDLPVYRFDNTSPAWSVCLMDLWGPITIRDDCVKKGPRVMKKVYGVIYSCALTRAVHLDVAIDYSSLGIMHTLRRLLARRGNVRKIISDPGTQLKGASTELKRWRKGWSMKELIEYGADKGLEWEFIMADSQHQNGASEILVKLVKGVTKTLARAMGETRLSLNDLFTLLDECANLVNERPIGLKPNSQTDPEYLSPNSLLLGRCSDRISAGPFESKEVFNNKTSDFSSRFLKVQRITDQFWKIWQKLFFPTLIVRQKWHHQKRNLCVGDICKLKDSNAIRGDWRICEVIKVYPDAQNVVRNVDVKVAAKVDGSSRYQFQTPCVLSRHVSNLIVILPVDEQGGQEDLS